MSAGGQLRPVVVVGSINVDRLVRASPLPGPGETVLTDVCAVLAA